MSFVSTSLGLYSELASIVGEAHVSSPEVQSDFGIDDVLPGAVITPDSPEEVAAVLRYASKRRLTVVPAGGMTKQSAGNAPERANILLRTERLNAVQHYDPGDLTVGFGAGMRIADVQRILNEHDQFLPFDVANSSRATIGGVLATNSHGPMKHAFGGVRDYCLGIHFVTADGRVAKGGGKVVKNVAGYDLMKLLIGSYGTLAVITSANFKVFPRPTRTRTFSAEFGTASEATKFRDAVMRSPLPALAMEIISPHAHEYLRRAGEARDPDHYRPAAPVTQATHWSLLLRASGSDAVLGRFAKELGTSIRAIEGSEELALWNAIADFEVHVHERHRNVMLMAVNTTIASVSGVLKAAQNAASEQNMLLASVGRAALGNLLLAFTPLSVDPPSAMQYANAASALRASLPKDGSAFVLRCPKEAKVHFNLWGSTPTDVTSMQAVREALDPHRTLNPGRFLV